MKKKKVTREELFTDVIKITGKENIRKRQEKEKEWNAGAIKQYRNKKKNMEEKLAEKSRATQGWITKSTVREIRAIGKKNKKKNQEVEEIILKIIIAMIVFSKEVYLKSIRRNRRNRKREGLRLEFTNNNTKNFKAVMEMKSGIDRRGIG